MLKLGVSDKRAARNSAVASFAGYRTHPTPPGRFAMTRPRVRSLQNAPSRRHRRTHPLSSGCIRIRCPLRLRCSVPRSGRARAGHGTPGSASVMNFGSAPPLLQRPEPREHTGAPAVRAPAPGCRWGTASPCKHASQRHAVSFALRSAFGPRVRRRPCRLGCAATVSPRPVRNLTRVLVFMILKSDAYVNIFRPGVEDAKGRCRDVGEVVAQPQAPRHRSRVRAVPNRRRSGRADSRQAVAARRLP